MTDQTEAVSSAIFLIVETLKLGIKDKKQGGYIDYENFENVTKAILNTNGWKLAPENISSKAMDAMATKLVFAHCNNNPDLLNKGDIPRHEQLVESLTFKKLEKSGRQFQASYQHKKLANSIILVRWEFNGARWGDGFELVLLLDEKYINYAQELWSHEALLAEELKTKNRHDDNIGRYKELYIEVGGRDGKSLNFYMYEPSQDLLQKACKLGLQLFSLQVKFKIEERYL